MEDFKENDEHSSEMVTSFLRRIVTAAAKLSNPSVDDEVVAESGGETPTELVDTIASHLLSACHPETLACGVSNFPAINETKEHDKPMYSPEEEENIKIYQYRRTDYLRLLS